nr:MAG TPA: hypothetical protein [Caudoviricetes sp.]
MEEKILQELKEVKEMLRIVASNTEQKENEISLVVSNIESKSKVAITKDNIRIKSDKIILDLECFNLLSPEVRFKKVIDLIENIREITKSEWEIIKIVIDDRFKKNF